MIEHITLENDLYLFELDNVIFEKRDYLAQVYYLFSSFYEFSEGNIKANDMAQFMCKVLDVHGEEKVFDATKIMFDVKEKYQANFERLIANAQLPIQLQLFQDIELLFKKLLKNHKSIAILTKGNPVEQLNKLKHIDWKNITEIKNNLKVFFIDELEYTKTNPISYLSEELNVQENKITFIQNR